MTRLSLRAACLVLLGSALAACAPDAPAPFSLGGEDGSAYALIPKERPIPGFEDAVGGGGRPSARFALREPVSVRGIRPALELEYELEGAARMELFSEERREAPLLAADLPRGPGVLRWIVPLPEGAGLSVFRFSVLPSGSEPGAAASILRIRGLRLRPAAFGFEKLPDGARFSRGVGVSRDAAGGEIIRIEHPYGAIEDPVLRMESRDALLRARAEGGRSVVLDSLPRDGAYIPLRALGAFGAVVVEAEKESLVASVSILPASELPGPLILDLAAVLALPIPEDISRQYELYRWSAFPECLVFDFRDYEAQDAYLKRLAFFVEKEGFRGRLARDSEISRLHGWNAHDYRAEDLAEFFDKAEGTSFPLSPRELELRGILERAGILVREGNRFKPGEGAIISISRESSAYLRALFLTHEAAHALFFLDKEYRDLARSLWAAQGPEERRFWNVFLSNRDYDPSDAYLSYNELQAYLVQQAPSQLEAWLREIAYPRLAKSYPDRAEAVLADLEAAIPGFKSKAERLDAYLRKTYGFRGGSFAKVRFE